MDTPIPESVAFVGRVRTRGVSGIHGWFPNRSISGVRLNTAARHIPQEYIMAEALTELNETTIELVILSPVVVQDLEEQDTTSIGHLSVIRQVGRARYREWIQQRLIYENIWNQILVALPSVDRRIIPPLCLLPVIR